MRKPSIVDPATVVRPRERRDGARGLGRRVVPGFLCAAILAGLGFALPARATYAPSAEGGKVAVATDSAVATEAALASLAAGGNAVDAAIAAALTLGVVNPISSGLGGGGFALVYMEGERKAIALDFRETAPRRVAVDDLVARKQKGGDLPEKRGASIGVPGEPAGLEWLGRRF